MSGLAIDRLDAIPHPAVAVSRRTRPLGAFRLGLALLVVLQHFQHLLPDHERRIFSQLGLGAVAVCVFFVVSGFVVAEAGRVFYHDRPAAFLANRLIRVVPPYLAALALSVLIHAWLWRAGRLVLWDFALSGSPLATPLLVAGVVDMVPALHSHLSGQDFAFIPFVWSLRMEMAFYLATCVALWAARSWRPAIPVAILLGLGACALFLIQQRPGLLSTGPMFLLGVALSLLLARRTAARCLLLAAASILAGAGFTSWGQHGHPVLSWQFSLLGLLLCLFAALSTGHLPARWRRIDRALGELSYPLYLNHYALGIVLFDTIPDRGAGLYWMAVLLSVVLAWIMAQLVESRLRPARDRVRRVEL